MNNRVWRVSANDGKNYTVVASDTPTAFLAAVEQAKLSGATITKALVQLAKVQPCSIKSKYIGNSNRPTA